MRKTKQVVALMLSVLLMICCVGCGKTNDNTETTTIGDAYTKVVQKAVNQYGIIDGDSYNSGTNQIAGVMAAERVDVTDDGNDELLLMYYDKDIHMEIYENKDNKAIKKWSASEPWDGEFSFNIMRESNCITWSWTSAQKYASDLAAFVDDEYRCSTTKGALTDEEREKFRDSWNEAYAARLGVIANEEYIESNLLLDYYAEGKLYLLNEEEFLTEWDVKIPEPRLSPLQALGNIKYYGNPAICKMSKEMAQAYANAIEQDKKLIGSENYGRSDVLRAALVDVAEDGMPLLITALSSKEPLYENWYSMAELFVWTWDGSEAKKYDFVADTNMGLVFEHRFYPGDDKVSIAVDDGMALGVGEACGTIYYTVSDAQITKIRHEMSYSAAVESNHVMVWGQRLPFVAEDEIGGKLENYSNASIWAMEDAGWIGEKGLNSDYYTSFHTYSVDGKQVNNPDSFWDEYTYGESYNSNKYNICGATTGNYELSGETTFADVAIDALMSYSDSVGRPYYSSYVDVLNALTDAQVKALAEEATKKFNGTVGEIYKLSDDLYYVTIYVDGEFIGGTVVKNVSNGTSWTVVESDNEVMSEEKLAQIVTKDNSVSNIVIDYKETKNAEKHIDKVLENIEGTTPNAAAKEELADYAQKYIAENSEGALKATDNCVVIDSKTISKAAESATDAKSEIDAVLEKHTIELNKKITVILRIVCRNMKSDEPMQITFDGSCLESMGDADAVYVELCDGYGAKISKENLSVLVDKFGKITVTITKTEDNSYNIQFADANSSVIHQIPVSMTFILPAENELSTVYAEYQGGTDNWGGQFDEAKKELSFETPYTGKYTVKEETADITDIAELSEEHQKAIRFMVSKGYFSVDEGKFNPNDTLTRYSFSESLVRMFFMLDRSMTSSFTDVSKESPYYPYVASGENANIIEGYDDNTFRGENDVLREEVIALCSRTLRERKGYAEPESPSDLLHFTDNDKIPEWAKSEIALAVRETLIQDGGLLSPDTAITRADSALLLYRLFMLLYEVEPVAVKNVSSMSTNGWIVSGVAVVVLACLGMAAVLLRRKKKQGETTENAEKKNVKYNKL